MDMNLMPKFVDEALTPPAQAVGSSLASIWQLAIGSHIDLWAKKQEHKQKLNLADYIRSVENKTQNIPEEHLKEPQLNIVGPAIEASKYFIDSKDLRDMFANLIASSIDDRKSNVIHPSFVEIIKQLTPDEAKIIRGINSDSPYPLISLRKKRPGAEGSQSVLEHFTDLPSRSGCESFDAVSSQIENLNRLGLIVIIRDSFLTNEAHYTPLENHSLIKEAVVQLNKFGFEHSLERYLFKRTDFGRNFYKSCIE